MTCSVNATAVDDGFARLPTHFLRHFAPHSMAFAQESAVYQGLKPWGRTRFVIHRGKLLFAPTLPSGCVLRRTPILAWALLSTLKRHPDLPDVAVTFNCRDKPTYWYPDGPQPMGSYEKATTAVPRDGKPALAFAYTTGHTFSDVPLPDATFWGLPYARIAPWDQWLRSTAAIAHKPWESRIDQMLWVGTSGVGNGKLGFSNHPLRGRFARCGPSTFGSRLHAHNVAKEDVDRLAWKCLPGAADCPPVDGWQPPNWIHLEEQCKYRTILHLPGVSDWLEHV